MNERIRELAEQAYNEQNPELLTNASHTFEHGVWLEGYSKKFAELIVRECIEQASISNGHGNNQWDKALTFAADNIKKHFGVGE